MDSFRTLFGSLLALVYHCFDRIVIQVRSLRLTKSNGSGRLTTSRWRSTIGHCGSRRRISASAFRTRRRPARSDRSLQPRRSINSGHSRARTAPRLPLVAMVPTPRHSTPVTSGCSRRIARCHASTSRRTSGCYSSAHACGEKVERDRDLDEDEDTTGPDRRVTAWTPELVQVSLEWLALRAALARRRAMWLTRLVDVSVVWREPASTVLA